MVLVSLKGTSRLHMLCSEFLHGMYVACDCVYLHRCACEHVCVRKQEKEK